MRRFDLIVIGAGMAGIAAANKCGAAGWSVAIVDGLPFGGTCALRGCDPKKILRRGAEIIDAARLMRGKGIDDQSLCINWSDLMKHKRGFTDPVPEKMEAGLRRNGVETLHGFARFVGPDRIEINGASFQAKRFLIATGSQPRELEFAGANHLIDSTDFLNLEVLPKRILFVGGGFISFEFAHIAARAGSVTSIIDRGARPLGGFDGDLVELLVARGQNMGVHLNRRSEILSVEKENGGFIVYLSGPNGAQSRVVDLVVHGAGRVPQLSSLGLDAAGVEFGKAGVKVAPHLRSVSNPYIYAAGDAAESAGMALTPVAVIQGKVAASNMLKNQEIVPDYTGIPTVVFTVPELARVGLLEDEAIAAGYEIELRFTDTSDWFSNYRIGETSAATKIIVDKSSDQILGAHLFGPESAELINFFGLAMKLGLTRRQLKSMTAAYPSMGSDLGSIL